MIIIKSKKSGPFPSVQQEGPLSARYKSQGGRPVIGCLSIIFGRSQILPSCPLFTVAYVINLFTLKRGASSPTAMPDAKTTRVSMPDARERWPICRLRTPAMSMTSERFHMLRLCDNERLACCEDDSTSTHGIQQTRRFSAYNRQGVLSLRPRTLV